MSKEGFVGHIKEIAASALVLSALAGGASAAEAVSTVTPEKQANEILQGWMHERGWQLQPDGSWVVAKEVNGFPVTPNGSDPVEDLLGTLGKSPTELQFTERQGLGQVLNEKYLENCVDPHGVE